MNILIVNRPVPMFGPRIIGEWLERSEGHKVETILHPRSSNRRYWPWTEYRIVQGIHDYLEENNFDVVICSDPAAVAAMRKPRKKEWVGKVIYWRMDYMPPVRFNLNSFMYQRADRAALKSDEVWAIARLSDPKVEASFQGCDTTVRHVPYLLPVSTKLMPAMEDGGPRENNAIWVGPDSDGSRGLAKACAMAAGCEFILADYTMKATARTERELFHELERAKVSVLPYKPSVASRFYYADPSRIKWCLAYGVPIVTTRVCPIWQEIEAAGAGVICEYRRRDIIEATRHVLENFEEMSRAASRLAEQYVVSDSWVKIKGR